MTLDKNLVLNLRSLVLLEFSQDLNSNLAESEVELKSSAGSHMSDKIMFDVRSAHS